MWNSDCSWWWGPGFFFGGPFGMIIGIAFWVLIAYALFRFIPNVTNRSLGVNQKGESALEILKRRYAKGEIDPEEFSRRKTDIES